jgi:hypothetical protein
METTIIAKLEGLARALVEALRSKSRSLDGLEAAMEASDVLVDLAVLLVCSEIDSSGMDEEDVERMLGEVAPSLALLAAGAVARYAARRGMRTVN